MNILVIGLCTLGQNPRTKEFDILAGGTEHVNHSLLTTLSSNPNYKISYLTQSGDSKCRTFYKSFYNLELCEKYTSSHLYDIKISKKYDLVIFSGLLQGLSVEILELFLRSNPSEVPPILFLTHGFNCFSNKTVSSLLKRYFTPSHKIYFSSSYYPEQDYFYNRVKDHAHRICYPIQEDDIKMIRSSNVLREINPKKNSRALYIARIDPQKGIENAIEICSRMKIPLDIYGRIQNLKYKNFLEDYPRNCEIRFLGSVSHSELCSKIRDYDIAFHLPSKLEGGSLSCKEIILSGTQLVTWRSDYQADLGDDMYPNIIYLNKPDNKVPCDYDEYSNLIEKSMIDYRVSSNYPQIISNIDKLYNQFSEDQFSDSITKLINKITSN